MLRPTLLVQILTLGLLGLLSACGGGGGGGTPALNQGAFAGTWDVTTTVTASTCPSDPVGTADTLQVVISVTGSTASIADPNGSPFTGAISGNSVRLTQAGTPNVIELVILNDQLGGTATTTDSSGTTPCTVTQTVTGVRTGTSQPGTGNFAGDWDFAFTTTASTCPSLPVGQTSTDRITITVTGTTATIADPGGNLTGTIQGNTVNLARPGDTVSLQINGDQLTGSATFQDVDGGIPCSYTFALTATRAASTGGALAIVTGSWEFAAIINTVPVTPFQGTIAQNGANVTFTVTSPFSQTWDGPLSGADWTPTITGAVPITVSGSFDSTGRIFTGTINSPSLGGSGTITGAKL